MVCLEKFYLLELKISKKTHKFIKLDSFLVICDNLVTRKTFV